MIVDEVAPNKVEGLSTLSQNCSHFLLCLRLTKVHSRTVAYVLKHTHMYIPNIIRCISKSAFNFSRASSAATAAAVLASGLSLATAQECLKAWNLARQVSCLALIVSVAARGMHLNSL